MTNDNRVRKVCDTCGHETWAARRDRTCYQKERSKKTGWRTGWRCPGKLRFVVVKRRRKEPSLPPVPKRLGLGHVLTEEYQQQVLVRRGEEWRAAATKQLDKARQRHRDAAEKAKRAEKKMREWTVKIRALEKKARMTDEQVEQVRQRAATAAQVSHVKRRLAKSAGIAIKEEEQQ